jgi:hypothetical protein
MTRRELVDQVLRAVFGSEFPERLGPLLDRELAARLLEDFKLGPIFPLASARRPRIAISNQGEVARWRSCVLDAFPHPRLARFLDAVPPEARRMIDSDGESAIVYLDDMQDAGEGLMFLTLDPRSGRLGRGTRHSEPPRDLVAGVLADALTALLGRGAEGIWSVRYVQKKPVGLVFVSESRWRKNHAKVNAILDALGTHPGIEACRSAGSEAGFVAYPDALEALPDGSWDVTLGFVRAQ